ncbi:hypothetical protein [Streptomyces lavendofoliae]|uniref:hypothetical protein n=1 Tax=Streptomyces lavendofoliae TaxID=67314 RepID=UPI003D8F68D8
MIRNVIGSILALVGAAAAVWSPFRAWHDGRHGRDYRIADLFGGITGATADLWTSLLLPFAFAALVTLVGLVLRSRVLVALAGLIVLGFTVLWMVRQGQEAGGLSVESDGSGLGQGVALAAAGGVLLLLGAALMAGRRRLAHDTDEPRGHGRLRGRRRHGRPAGEPDHRGEPYTDPYGEPYAEPGREPYGQRPYEGDAPTAEYPRQGGRHDDQRHDQRYGDQRPDDRYDDRPGRPDDGPPPGRG